MNGEPQRLFGDHAERVALVATDGQLTFAKLEARSVLIARALASAGLVAGDRLCLVLPNCSAFVELMWAGLRSGLYVTPVNWHLKAHEVAHILRDSNARAVVVSSELGDLLDELQPHLDTADIRLIVGNEHAGFTHLDSLIARTPHGTPFTEAEGAFMFYSSGTTGYPKGIIRPLSGAAAPSPDNPGARLLARRFGLGPDAVYLCPAPLYHAAPLTWTRTAQLLGGTVVLMDRFDPVEALRLIERHRVTVAQFVPTHLGRLLDVPADVRSGFDVSSLRSVIHAAAPCPPDVKRRMIDWLGPVVDEYYSGSESIGMCAISSAEWLERPGSVGRAVLGTVHIADDDGAEPPTGGVGTVWFAGGAPFAYHDDPDKTRDAVNDRGWATMGDVGYLDDDGYLFLVDRRADVIISGGVNVYPQEIERELATHPAVREAAVIGVADGDLGQRTVAVVVAAPGATPGDVLADELIAHCRERLAGFKCPRRVEFVDELPRLATGKLLRRDLRDRYGPTSATT